jgi:hypothetical protein
LRDLNDLIDDLMGRVSNTIDSTSIVNADRDYHKWKESDPLNIN